MNVMFDTADPAFDYHDEYYSINTGAHRKGGIELVTPTLTHHLGFWFPNTRNDDVPQRTVERYGAIVDLYVMAIYRELRDWEAFECNFEYLIEGRNILGLFGGAYAEGDEEPLPRFRVTTSPLHFALKDAIESDNRILFLKAHWCGLKVIVRCEFHSEYFTVSRFVTVIDSESIPPEVGELTNHLAMIARLGEADAVVAPGTCASSISDCHVFLYQGFWERLDRVLFRGRPPFAATATDIRSRIFADFRGLVLAGNDTPPKGQLSIRSFVDDTQREPFAGRWPLDCLIPTIWPFLTAKAGLDLKRREFTASFMLGQRAVYITALGPQPPADDGFRCAPLNYFLVARPISDWQLGALVDRLHFMGTVRLAALMELHALRMAGANLRDMEQEAEKARKAIEDNDTETAYHHYKRVIALLAHKDARHQPIFHAGLQFRVERSRYYVQRFADFVPFLGMSQIEGFQQYDQFVKSRLGGIYDYIDRLGHRQERAVVGATAISQAISLREVAEANRQSAEANRQSATANEQNSVISKTIAKLQTKAEIALLGVIVPHYVMDIISGFEERWHAGDKTTVKWDIAIMSVAIMMSVASLCAYLWDRRKDDDHEGATGTLLKYFFLFILSIVITITVMAAVHL